MALPPVGNSISISQIKTELSSSSNSLRTLSAEAGKSAPDAMSEFFGYSNITCAQYEATNAYGDWYEPSILTWTNCDPYYGTVGTQISAQISYGETRLICSETTPLAGPEFIVEFRGGCPV